jgi:hypothetical protein
MVSAWPLSLSVSACVAAIAIAPADENRSSGFFAMPRAITWSNAAGMPGRSTLGRGTGCIKWAVMTTLTLSPP